ncbi:50S ribosomal protein L30 [Streptomyces phaeochromogenes]
MARIEDQALVVQTRSAIGRGEKQRATLRSLGLRHIGDIAQRDISNPCVVGMIRSVQHLIRVYPYPSLPLSHSERVETPNLLVRKYGTDQWPARHIEAGNAEYVRIEANGDALGLGWSTRLSLRESLAFLKQQFMVPEIMPQGSIRFKYSAFDNGTPPGDLLTFLKEHADSVSRVLLSYPDMLFSWWAKFDSTGRTGKHEQIFLSVDRYDENAITELLKQSATLRVSARAEEIARLARFVVPKVPQGELTLFRGGG